MKRAPGPVARALGPDAAPVGLHQALADGQPQAGPDSAAPGLPGALRELAEQVRQTLGRDARALVVDRDRDVIPVPGRGHAHGRQLGRVARRVGEQVGQDLHDALRVHQHARQIRRQIDQHGVPAAPAQVQVPRLVDDGGEARGLGRDRQTARLHVRRVQQVADQLAHVIRLLPDDPEELHRLGRAQPRRRLHRRRRRAPDRTQRGLELVAHHAQELGAEHLELLERRQVLHRDHHRLDVAPLRADGRGVDQRVDPPAVRRLQHHLLHANRPRLLQDLAQGVAAQLVLPAVGAPHAHQLQQILLRLARLAETPNDAARLPVHRHRLPGTGVQHGHADRRGVDQGLQIRPRPLDRTVVPRVGDRRAGLRREQRQDLLVLARELEPALLVAQEKAADLHAPVADRRAQEAPRQRLVAGEARRVHVRAQVAQPARTAEPAQVFPELRPVGERQEALALGGTEARRDEILQLARVVHRRDHPHAGAAEHPRAPGHLAQNRVDVQALADPQTRLAQLRQPLPKLAVLPAQLFDRRHPGRHLPGPGQWAARTGRPHECKL